MTLLTPLAAPEASLDAAAYACAAFISLRLERLVALLPEAPAGFAFALIGIVWLAPPAVFLDFGLSTMLPL